MPNGKRPEETDLPVADRDEACRHLSDLLRDGSEENANARVRAAEALADINGWRKQSEDLTTMEPQKLETLAHEVAPIFLEFVTTRALQNELRRRKALKKTCLR